MHIEHLKITDDKDPCKKYYILDALNFEGLMIQMRTSKVVELCKLFSLMKIIVIKYYKYEKYYERYSAELLQYQNNQL